MTLRPIPDQPDFAVSNERDGDRVVVTVRGELDLATAAPFEAAVRAAVEDGPVLLDLGALVFMDSSGVRVLDALLRDREAQAWDLRVRDGLQDGVRQVLELTGVLAVVPFADGAA